jgi:hypothetical protein
MYLISKNFWAMAPVVFSLAAVLCTHSDCYAKEQIPQPYQECSRPTRVDLDGDGIEDTVEFGKNGRIVIKIFPEDTWHETGLVGCYVVGKFLSIANMENVPQVLAFSQAKGGVGIVGLKRRGNADDLVRVGLVRQIFNPFANDNVLSQFAFIDINGDGLLDILGYWRKGGELKVVLTPFPNSGGVIKNDTWSCPISRKAINNGNYIFFYNESKDLIRADFDMRIPKTIRTFWIRPDGFRASPDKDALNLGTRPCIGSP